MSAQTINAYSTRVMEIARTVGGGVGAGLGGYVCALICSIEPAGGAILTASAFLIHKITAPFFFRIFNKAGANLDSRTLGSTLHRTSSLVISFTIAKLAVETFILPNLLCGFFLAFATYAVTLHADDNQWQL